MGEYAVLIVEDDRRFRTLLARRLTERGWRVTTAATVAAGLQWLRTQPFDVVLLDLALPDGSGWEVARATEGVPVIVMTCYEISTDDVRSVRPARVFSKPLALAELFGAMEHCAAGVTAAAGNGQHQGVQDAPLS